MQQKPKQQSNNNVVAKAGKIEKELEANPEIVDVLLGSGKFQAMVRHETHYSGPLPPPEVMQSYDEILPGGAERLFAMAENEQKFRHSTQDMAIRGTISRDKRGQWMGFAITMVILGIASVFAYRGNTIFAGTLIGLDLIGLATVFVIGRRSPPRKED